MADAATALERMLERGVVPDLLTDQTSAHDPLSGYVPRGLSLSEADMLRESDPESYKERSISTMADHVRAMLSSCAGAHTLAMAIIFVPLRKKAVWKMRSIFRALFRLTSVRSFVKARGPFRWVALSGDPENIYVTDRVIAELFPEDEALARWLRMARGECKFQGLPSRICGLVMASAFELGWRSMNWFEPVRSRRPSSLGETT